MQANVFTKVRSYLVHLIQIVLKWFSFSTNSNISSEVQFGALVRQLEQVSEEKEKLQCAFETAKRDWEEDKQELLARINFLEANKLGDDKRESENGEKDEVEFLGQFQLENTIDLVEQESDSSEFNQGLEHDQIGQDNVISIDDYSVSNYENGMEDLYKALTNETNRMREQENIRERPNPTPTENQHKLLRQIVCGYAKYLQKCGMSQENVQIFSLNLLHSNSFWKKCINAAYYSKLPTHRVNSYVSAILKLVKNKERAVVLDALRSVGCSEDLSSIFVKLADDFELRKGDPGKNTFKEFIRPV